LKGARQPELGQKGMAALELAFLLPLLLIMVLWIIDFGRLVQASLIVTNVSREGGSIISRGINSGENFLDMLQASGVPLDLNGAGRIYATRIAAGASASQPDPSIDTAHQLSRGSLAVNSRIRDDLAHLGVSEALYQHLRFEDAPQNTSDIAEVWVVEVYYLYRPITPLPDLVNNLLITPGHDGRVIGIRSVF